MPPPWTDVPRVLKRTVLKGIITIADHIVTRGLKAAVTGCVAERARYREDSFQGYQKSRIHDCLASRAMHANCRRVSFASNPLPKANEHYTPARPLGLRPYTRSLVVSSSASTMMRTSSSKRVFGSHPSCFLALAGFPISRSTSAGLS